VQSFFNGIQNGVVPAILLPESLTPSSSITGFTDDSGKLPKIKQAQGKGKGKQERNLKVMTEWRIPLGK
jgi:hypothetical protein